MHNNTLTRFIGKSTLIEQDGKPKIGVFALRPNERGLSLFDIEKFVLKNQNEEIFLIGDKYVCLKPPKTIARCDLRENNIKEIEKKLKEKNEKIKFLIEGKIFCLSEKEKLHRELIYKNVQKHQTLLITQLLLTKSTFVKNEKNSFWKN